MRVKIKTLNNKTKGVIDNFNTDFFFYLRNTEVYFAKRNENVSEKTVYTRRLGESDDTTQTLIQFNHPLISLTLPCHRSFITPCSLPVAL